MTIDEINNLTAKFHEEFASKNIPAAYELYTQICVEVRKHGVPFFITYTSDNFTDEEIYLLSDYAKQLSSNH